MNEVVLISCVKSKRENRSRAADIYVSDWFRKALAYARTLNPDQLFILSAKHGLLGLDQVIEPYEKSLKNMRIHDRRDWADRVLLDLRRVTDLERDHFVFLAGYRYREFLLPAIKNYAVPMEGLRQGQQLRWLAKWVGQ